MLLLLYDILFVTGVIVVIVGCYMVWPPLAWMVGGVGVMAMSAVMARSAAAKDTPTSTRQTQRNDGVVISTKDRDGD